MSEANQARKLKFSVLACKGTVIEIIFSAENGASDICCFRGVILSPYNCYVS